MATTATSDTSAVPGSRVNREDLRPQRVRDRSLLRTTAKVFKDPAKIAIPPKRRITGTKVRRTAGSR